ncbi:MAG TPA: hypothetical protein VMG34_10305 [Bacteroidota bacterium]|nr:hypothetical protein [Bacteroidota bacterium]
MPSVKSEPADTPAGGEFEVLVDASPRVDVDDAEFKRLLGYPPDHPVGDRVQELLDATKLWYEDHGRPWVVSTRAASIELGSGDLRIGGVEFTSDLLRSQLVEAAAGEAMLVAASAGKECEERAKRLWEDSKPDEYFFMEVYGSAVVENLIRNTGARFCDWADSRGKSILPHYSPGYPGWGIADQSRLLALIRKQIGGEFPGPIEVLESGMLRPKKSILALFGVTDRIDAVIRLDSLIPCDNCSLKSCRYRRRPYRHAVPQIEDIRTLQPIDRLEPRRGRSLNSPLDTSASYKTSLRALEKWSRERLRISILDDRSVEARFRYEGTTCSNMGHGLEFDYHIRLSTPEEHHTILSAECVPAPGDIGHTLMCQYLENPRALMAAISREKPLLGRPLNDVLTWEREYTPSGCYCNAESRDYKWGLVLEVLHFALAREATSPEG